MSQTNNENSLKSIIQFLLNKFKVSRRVENASFQFNSNPTVYEIEAQLPELWLRSRNPIDKNLAYYSDQVLNLPEKKFPDNPYIIHMESSFSSKEISVSKIELDQLFGKCPLEAKKEDLSLEATLKKGHVHVEEEKKAEHQMKTKKWYITFPNNIYYGPYSGEEVYMFIKNISKIKNLKKLNFMVADSESDYYFKPEAIYELFCEDLKLENEDINIEKRLEKVCEDICGKSEKKFFVERNFPENKNLMTKFDVAELKSKYKNAFNINITSLNKQLSNLKLMESNKENMGFYTNLNTPSNSFSNKFGISKMNNLKMQSEMKKVLTPQVQKKNSFDIRNDYVKEKLSNIFDNDNKTENQ